MSEPELPGNSQRKRDQANDPVRPKIERLTQGEVVVRRPGVIHKLRKAFIADDFGTVGDYVMAEVVFPKLRMLVIEVGNAALERTFGGGGPEPRRRTVGFQSTGRPGVSYRPSQRGRPDGRRTQMGPRYAPEQPTRNESGEYIVQTREEAERILETMTEIGKIDGFVSTLTFHELLGIDHTPQDARWGWTDLKDVVIRSSRQGWVMDMPPETEPPPF